MPGPKSWQISRALLNNHQCDHSIARLFLDVKLVEVCRTDRKGKDGLSKLTQVNIGRKWPEMAFKALLPLPLTFSLPFKRRGGDNRPGRAAGAANAPALGGGGGTWA